MEKKKGNLLQTKTSENDNKENKDLINTDQEEKGVRYIEDKMNTQNKNLKIVEITPRLSSIDIQDLNFDEKVEALANELKDRIFNLHEEGYSVRYIANQVHMSRESVRKVLKGKSSLKIIAMERVRAQEVQQLNF